MNTRNFIVLLALLSIPGTLGSAAQPPLDERAHEEQHRKLPNGKSQEEEILKEDHKKAQEDAGQLVELAQQIQADLEKEGRYVLSVGTLKKLDDAEKTIKRLRSRLKK